MSAFVLSTREALSATCCSTGRLFQQFQCGNALFGGCQLLSFRQQDDSCSACHSVYFLLFVTSVASSHFGHSEFMDCSNTEASENCEIIVRLIWYFVLLKQSAAPCEKHIKKAHAIKFVR